MAGVQKNMEIISREGNQKREEKALMRDTMLTNPEFRAWAHAEQRLIAELEQARLRIRNIMDEKRESAGNGLPTADRQRLGFELKKNRQEYFRLSFALGELRERMNHTISQMIVRRTCQSIKENQINGEFAECVKLAESVKTSNHLPECAYRYSIERGKEMPKYIDMRVY